MNSIDVYQVDAFTDQPFMGNPAAVCTLNYPLDDRTYLNIAREMNLSETAFVISENRKDFINSKVFDLRWFTPKIEVPLCGHATLASSWVLYNELGYKGRIHFKTKSGSLLSEITQEGIALDFPQDHVVSIETPDSLPDAIGYNNKFEAFYGKNTGFILLRLENEHTIRELKPDFKKLNSLSFDVKVRGLIVTSESSGNFDFVSRFFDPWEGIDEDPVTGSAHTVLGPFWSNKLEKNTLLAKQLSARTGKLLLQIQNDERIFITGKAVTIMKGNLYF